MSEISETLQSLQAVAHRLDSIVDFRVKFDAASSLRSKVLYGNGRMQVRVQVLVSGQDINGNPVTVPQDVIDTVELIHYDTGRTLRNGWGATTEQGRFTLEAQTYNASQVTDEEDDANHPQLRSFWVSSSGVGTAQIAARLVFDGQVIRSNGSNLSSHHDSSVTLEAQAPLTYSIDQFRWSQTRRGNEAPGNRIWNYYLGLYPHGQQVKLVDWIVAGAMEGKSVQFAYGNRLMDSSTNFVEGKLIRPETLEESVVLPVDGSWLVSAFTSEDVTWNSKLYRVKVNDRDGELTVVQALSEYSSSKPESRMGDLFHFSAIDQYGTEHKLRLRTNFAKREFYLERG